MNDQERTEFKKDYRRATRALTSFNEMMNEKISENLFHIFETVTDHQQRSEEIEAIEKVMIETISSMSLKLIQLKKDRAKVDGDHLRIVDGQVRMKW